MSVIGRPTSYRPELCELACNYCLLGATNEELAGFFDVAPRTIDNWIARIPEFAAAVREGRAVADSRVARALHQRAVGYTCTVRRTVLWRGEERVLTREVHYPPDVRACIFWLRNRRRQDWSEKPQPPSDDLPDWFDASQETRQEDASLELPSEVDGEENARDVDGPGGTSQDDRRAEQKGEECRERHPAPRPVRPFEMTHGPPVQSLPDRRLPAGS